MEREKGPQVKSSFDNFSLKHSEACDVHAESLDDVPHDCKKGC